MKSSITPEKLIKLGFTIRQHPIFNVDCYWFPERLKLGKYYLNNDVLLGWWVWVGWSESVPLRKVEDLYHLDNFVHGMTDEWLIELKEDNFLENTF